VAETASQRLHAGKVGRPHGLDGSFHVTGALPRLLQVGTTVSIGGRTATVVRLAGVPGRPIVHVEGIEDRSGAQAIRGLELSVWAPDAPPLGEGEWWAQELEGCSVHDGDRRVGRVIAMIELPSCEALQVSREDGSQLLVPMVRDAVRSVDVQARRIEVDMEFLGER
jgi:16S rRNA processing protein RimM